MISRDEFYTRRCVEDLIVVIEQVPLRAAARMPLQIDRHTIAWIVLWTLLRWERTFLIRGLEERGVDLDGLVRDLDQLIRDARARASQAIGVSASRQPRLLSVPVDVAYLLRPLLDCASDEAFSLGQRYVGTEHLLLVLIASADPLLAGLLDRHGLTDQTVRQMLAELIPAEDAADAEVLLEPVGLDKPSGPSGASWDRHAAGVPRRFGMAIVLLIMTMYAVLFTAMKLLGAPPIVFVVIAVFFTGVGLGQMLLFGGRYPRAASIWVGACLLPIEAVGTFIYTRPSHVGIFEALSGAICLGFGSIPLGAGFGYLAGGLTAGVFFLLEEWARRHAVPEEDVDVLGTDMPEDGPPEQSDDAADPT